MDIVLGCKPSAEPPLVDDSMFTNTDECTSESTDVYDDVEGDAEVSSILRDRW